MLDSEIGQLIRHVSSGLEGEATAFVIDGRARGSSRRTIEYESEELQHRLKWLSDHKIMDKVAQDPAPE